MSDLDDEDKTNPYLREPEYYGDKYRYQLYDEVGIPVQGNFQQARNDIRNQVRNRREIWNRQRQQQLDQEINDAEALLNDYSNQTIPTYISQPTQSITHSYPVNTKMSDGANYRGSYRGATDWNAADYPAYGGNFGSNSINVINPRAVYQKSLMARAKANRDYRELARLKREYRTNMRAAGVVRLTPTVDANGYVGWGRYRRRGRRIRRRWRRRGYKGRGFYKGFWGDAGSFLGNAASRGLGVPGLGALGRAGGNWLAGKVGFGAYEDANPTEDITGSVPLMMNVANTEGVITLTKREYIGDVISQGSQLQKLYEININPGDASLCPWASDIARKFEKWKLISMIFHYVAHSGDTTTSVQLGRVMGCHLNDPIREPPSTVGEISQINMSDLTAPCNSKSFGIECDPGMSDPRWRWIRRIPASYTENDRLEETDHGRFFLYCDGIPGGAGINVGALYVSYEIALLNPLHTGVADNFKAQAAQWVTDGVSSGSPYLLGQATQVLASAGQHMLNATAPIGYTVESGYYKQLIQFKSEVVGKFRIDIHIRDANPLQEQYALMCAVLKYTSSNMRLFRGFAYYGNGINDWGNNGPLQKYTALSGQEIPVGSTKAFNNNPAGTAAPGTHPFDDNTTFTYFVEKFATGSGSLELDSLRSNGNNAGMPTTPAELLGRTIINTAVDPSRRSIMITKLPNDYSIIIA